MSSIIEKVIIFTGGDAPKQNILSNMQHCMIIAVDSGCLVCETWGIIPDVVVGDFDSYPLERIKHIFPKTKIHTLHKNKLYTDTEVAIVYAHRYSHNITVVGGFGGRIDHFLGNIEQFKRPLAPTRLIGSEYQLEKISDICSIDSTYIADKYISFFPLTPHTKQKTSGLRWNLDDIMLDNTLSSISNEYISERIHITMREGSLLAVWKHTGHIQL